MVPGIRRHIVKSLAHQAEVSAWEGMQAYDMGRITLANDQDLHKKIKNGKMDTKQIAIKAL